MNPKAIDKLIDIVKEAHTVAGKPECDKCNGAGTHKTASVGMDGIMPTGNTYCTCPAGQKLKEGG